MTRTIQNVADLTKICVSRVIYIIHILKKQVMTADTHISLLYFRKYAQDSKIELMGTI